MNPLSFVDWRAVNTQFIVFCWLAVVFLVVAILVVRGLHSPGPVAR